MSLPNVNVTETSSDVAAESDREHFGYLLRNFGETATCHGLPRIIISRSLSKKLVWLLIFLVAMGGFTFQAYELIKLFLAYDVRVNIEIGTAAKLAFPAVTICNANKLRLSEIEKSEHSPLAKTDPEHPDSIHKLLSYESPCLHGDYECADRKRCIKQHLRCDGYFHCWDGFSDESNCTYTRCGEGMFNCGQAGFHGICISEEKRCDGVRDCIGGEDEENCPVCLGGVPCDFGLESSGYKCVPVDSMCDRFPDCIDRNDERYCSFFDDCIDGRLLASTTPSISYSTNYPSDYANDYTCVMHLTVPPFNSGEETEDCIFLSFLELDVEHSEGCQKDFIEIRDSSNPNITVRYCGSSIPPSWISSSSDVVITFVSDSDVTGRGYRIQYSSVKCQSSHHWELSPWSECTHSCGGGHRFRNVQCSVVSPAEDTVCEPPGSLPAAVESCNNEPCPGDTFCNKLLTECCMNVTSPGFPNDYPPDVDCGIDFLNEGGCIVLSITEIDIVDSEDCHKDYLEYREFQTDGGVRTERFCGQQSGLRMMSPSSSVSLLFHSDSLVSGRGFRASYEFVPCGTWHMSEWSECNVACGYGERIRRVECISRTENNRIEDSFCQGEKPAVQQPCDQICGVKEPPKSTYDDLDFLTQTHRHITDDIALYLDFLNNYYKSNDFDRVEEGNDPDWIGFLSFSSSPDYSDLKKVLRLTKEDVARYGHQAEDLILQCSFNEAYCNYSDFYVFENDHFGNCFTFNNWQLNGQDFLNSRRPGNRYGLKLTLFIEQNEYIPLYGQEAGVRVLIHHPSITPFPEDEGITVAPGLKTSIALRLETLEKLGPPYSKCSDDHDLHSIYGLGYRYSDLDCHKNKIQEYIRDECGCVDTMYMEGKPCNVANYKEEMCRQLMEFFYQRGLLSNDCKDPCTEMQYRKTISQSQWPSSKHVNGLIKVLRPLNDKVREHVVDEKTSRDNLLHLEVFYEELNYERVTESSAYTIEELLADIGGTLGLYLGVSLITGVEILEFVLNVFRHLLCKTVGTKSSNV